MVGTNNEKKMMVDSTKTILGERIIEGNLAYICQEGDNVTVVTVNGISKTMPIGELAEFVKDYPMPSDIREELDILLLKIKE